MGGRQGPVGVRPNRQTFTVPLTPCCYGSGVSASVCRPDLDGARGARARIWPLLRATCIEFLNVGGKPSGKPPGGFLFFFKVISKTTSFTVTGNLAALALDGRKSAIEDPSWTRSDLLCPRKDLAASTMCMKCDSDGREALCLP